MSNPPCNGRIEFVVDHIRSEIIAHENFWERIGITIIVERYQNSTVKRINSIMSGRYGVGLSRPPKIEGYEYAIGRKYKATFHNYNTKLLMRYIEFLTLKSS